MKRYLDSNVIVAGLIEAHADHDATLASGATGPQIHDAFHCAMAKRLKVGQIVTLNERHFAQLTRLQVIKSAPRESSESQKRRKVIPATRPGLMPRL